VEAERREVGVDRRARIGEPAAGVGVDAGMPRGEAGGHDSRLLEGEALELPARRGQLDDERMRLREHGVLAGRRGERAPEAGGVERLRPVAKRVDGDPLPVSGGRLRRLRPESPCVLRLPDPLRSRRGACRERRRGQRDGDDGAQDRADPRARSRRPAHSCPLLLSPPDLPGVYCGGLEMRRPSTPLRADC
jgi:hypothetical protein